MGRRSVPKSVLLIVPAIVLASLVSISCRSPVTPAEHGENYPLFRSMRDELDPVSTWEEWWSPEVELTRRYYSIYSNASSDATHDVGYIETEGTTVAVHRFVPSLPTREIQGVVFFVHGYLSNVKEHQPLIHALVDDRFIVIAPELPGHGLSGGVRGDVDSFPAYGTMVEDLITETSPPEFLPWSIVGHSTGAVAIIEYLRNNPNTFRRIAFAAPLIRNRMYTPARIGRWLTRPLLKTVGTKYDSPLGVPRMPLSWFDSQIAWNEALPEDLRLQTELLVIQGTRDRVVAWRYNKRVIQRIFPSADYRIVPGGEHTLYQGRPRPRREEAIETTIQYLSVSNEGGDG